MDEQISRLKEQLAEANELLHKASTPGTGKGQQDAAADSEQLQAVIANLEVTHLGSV